MSANPIVIHIETHSEVKLNDLDSIQSLNQYCDWQACYTSTADNCRKHSQIVITYPDVKRNLGVVNFKIMTKRSASVLGNATTK